MAKYVAKITFGSPSNYKRVGEFSSIEEAAEASWKYAYNEGYTRSNCENHDSVVEALMTRQYCMLGYGPDEIEIEEV